MKFIILNEAETWHAILTSFLANTNLCLCETPIVGAILEVDLMGIEYDRIIWIAVHFVIFAG